MFFYLIYQSTAEVKINDRVRNVTLLLEQIGGTAIGSGIGWSWGNDSKVRALQNNTFKKADRMWKITGWKAEHPEEYDELKKYLWVKKV